MNILLVFSGDHGVVLNILPCLRGQNIFVLGTQKQSPLSISNRCKYSYIESLNSKEILNNINEFCSQKNIKIIIPVDMVSIFALINLRDKLKSKLFLLDSQKKLRLLNDKYQLYLWLKTFGIHTPRTMLLKNIRHDISFPAILKPTNLSGLRGVKKVDSQEEILLHITSGSSYSGVPLLIQDYITGEDIDVSILAFQGKIIAFTIQKWCENGIIQFIDSIEALHNAQKIVSEMQFSGIAHFDMRIEKNTNKVYVLECNPRVWGSIAASYWAGVNFLELGIQATLKKRYPTKPPAYKKDYYVLISVLYRVLLYRNFKYISKLTRMNILDVLSDPFPFFITQFEIIFKRN